MGRGEMWNDAAEDEESQLEERNSKSKLSELSRYLMLEFKIKHS